ncbi:class I SAM-dependent methyltransferase [Desulfobulbus propionicus]
MKINARQYDAIAKSVFAPVYPLIADQIIEHTGITSGSCLDLGCGPGSLGAALARKTDLYLLFFDQSEEMLELCERTIDENGLRGRAGLLPGDIGSIALPDGSVDLIISRGSIFFWDDLPQAFREIYRVLAPGGKTFIGGGFGSAALKESIRRQMADRNQGKDQFGQKMRTNLGPEMRRRFEEGLQQAAINSFTILQDEEIGLWIRMHKPAVSNNSSCSTQRREK